MYVATYPPQKIIIIKKNAQHSAPPKKEMYKAKCATLQ